LVSGGHSAAPDRPAARANRPPLQPSQLAPTASVCRSRCADGPTPTITKTPPPAQQNPASQDVSSFQSETCFLAGALSGWRSFGGRGTTTALRLPFCPTVFVVVGFFEPDALRCDLSPTSVAGASGSACGTQFFLKAPDGTWCATSSQTRSRSGLWGHGDFSGGVWGMEGAF